METGVKQGQKYVKYVTKVVRSQIILVVNWVYTVHKWELINCADYR